MLFVSNMPEGATEATLSMLFGQFPGLKEVRLVPNRSDIAFVEFDGIANASKAVDGLNGFFVTPQQQLCVAFANK